MDRDPGAVLLGKQTAAIEETGLDELRDAIGEFHPPAAKATARWSLKKKEFLKKFREVLPSLPKPPIVHQDILKEEQEKTTAAMEMYEQVSSEKKDLLAQVRELEKAKDATEVKKIMAKHTPKLERYEQLVGEVQKALSKITDLEVRGVYSSIKNEPWVPEPETYDEEQKTIERAVDSAWVEWTFIISKGIDGLVANQNHPRMTPVFQAIKELEECIDKELIADIIENLEKKHECYISVTNRQYWEEVLYERRLLD